MKTVKLSQSSSPHSVVNLKYCDAFGSKLIGLMFTKELKPDHGIIMVEEQESKINTSIHMMFMNYDLTVLWLDAQMVVVDKVLARKWMPFYISKKPAKYVVELHSEHFADYAIGEQLILTP